jgi:hypothetical protein
MCFQPGSPMNQLLIASVFFLTFPLLTTPISGQSISQAESRNLLSVADLKIHDLDNSFCIARNRNTRDCILDVFQFNNWCEAFNSFNFLQNNGLDSVRKASVDICLKNVFYLQQAKKWRLDSVSSIMNMVNTSTNRSVSEIQKRECRALYEKFYQDCFAKRSEPLVQLIGSSDSLVAESLLRGIIQEKNINSDKRIGVSIPLSKLPFDILKNLDSIASGRTKLVGTKYGYFAVRVTDSTINYPEIAFASAQAELHEIAIHENVQDYDRRFLREYYNENLDEFLVPDTLNLIIWLVSYKNSNAGSVTNKPMNVEIPAKIDFDTSTLKSITLNQWMLPDSIRNVVCKQDSLLKAKECALIKNTVWGTWCIKFVAVRKGNGRIPFARVEWNEISQTQLEALDNLRSIELRNAYLCCNLGVSAHSYRKSLIPRPTDSDLLKMAALQNLDTTGFNGASPDAKNTDSASVMNACLKKMLFEMKYSDYAIEGEIQKWMENVAIDTRVYNIR